VRQYLEAQGTEDMTSILQTILWHPALDYQEQAAMH